MVVSVTVELLHKQIKPNLEPTYRLSINTENVTFRKGRKQLVNKLICVLLEYTFLTFQNSFPFALDCFNTVSMVCLLEKFNRLDSINIITFLVVELCNLIIFVAVLSTNSFISAPSNSNQAPLFCLAVISPSKTYVRQINALAQLVMAGDDYHITKCDSTKRFRLDCTSKKKT